MTRVLVASIILAAGVACSAGRPGATSSPPDASAQPSLAPTGSANAAATATATAVATDRQDTPAPTLPVPTAAPTPTQAPRVTSTARDEQGTRNFWNAVTASGEFGREYETLKAIADDVDLIAVGRIAEIYLADVNTTSGAYPSIWAKFEISDVLKGVPVSREPGFIDVRLTTSEGWQYAVETVPDEEIVLFLMNDAAYKARYGQEPVDPGNEPYIYWRTNPQGVLRNVDGQVDVIDRELIGMDYGEHNFPMTVVGDSFDTTIETIRAEFD